MYFSRRQGTFISGLLSFALTFIMVGQLQERPSETFSNNAYLESIETKVFKRLAQERKSITIHERGKAKARIKEVIESYRTGMSDDNIELTPDLIVRESDKYGYDPLFLTALIITESSFNNWAKSRRGALGLMQIRPATGLALAQETKIEWNGVPTLYEPDSNIALGAYYLNKLLERFGDLCFWHVV